MFTLPTLPRRPRYDQICCPNHPEAILIEDYRAGDQICPECGLVVGDRVIDVGAEWRTFNNENSNGVDMCRVGGPDNPLLNGSDLSTIIGPSVSGQFGENKYSNRKPNLSTTDRALTTAFRDIVNMADKINLPNVITDRAKYLFKQIYEGKSLRGRSNNAIASACLYIACRQEGVARTFKEICAVTSISKKEIGRCFKLILKRSETTVENIDINNYMPRFCSNLGISDRVQTAVLHIANKALNLDIVPGRSPITVAAAAIYMASQASEIKKTHKEVGDVTGVADTTIRQSYRQMYPHAAELFPANFVFTTPIYRLPPS